MITGLNTGGAEMMLYKLLSRSDSARFGHVVISLMESGPIGDQILKLGVPVHSLAMRPGVPDPRAILRLRQIVKQAAPDIVQTWLYHADLMGLVSTVRLGIPLVWNIRTSFDTDLGRELAAIVRLNARLSTRPAAVVANSWTAKALHTDLGYQPKAWQVLPNGFDTRRFLPDAAARLEVRNELGLPADSLLIGLVARFDPQKDHASFIQAANLLLGQGVDARFVLVGSHVTAGNLSLNATIARGGASDRFTLLGERFDIPRLTAAFDIATSSSAYGDSFPNVIGEAMACAVPCVVTDVGDSARIVGATGRVVSPRNPEALAAAWRDLIELGPEGRLALGYEARARVEALYSLESVVQQYETLYESLARNQ